MEQSWWSGTYQLDKRERRKHLMKRFFLIGLAASSLAFVPAFSASAMPAAHPSTLIDAANSTIQIKGGHGHGHGWGRHGGRGHHYGWGRGRGHHYGWRRHR